MGEEISKGEDRILSNMEPMCSLLTIDSLKYKMLKAESPQLKRPRHYVHDKNDTRRGLTRPVAK